MSSTCRSCGAPVLWARSESGRPSPVNPEPVRGGNIALREPADPREDLVAVVVGPGRGTHVSHFVSCPQSKEWRKAR